MKKIVLSIFISAFFAVTLANAQGIGLGIKGGVNFANQSIKDISQQLGDFSTKGRTGFHGGAYVVLAFSEKWAIQPEIMFSSQGSEIPDVEDLRSNKFNYLSIPVLLRWKPVSLLSIEAGPQFSSLMSAKDVNGDSIKDNFKNGDFGKFNYSFNLSESLPTKVMFVFSRSPVTVIVTSPLVSPNSIR